MSKSRQKPILRPGKLDGEASCGACTFTTEVVLKALDRNQYDASVYLVKDKKKSGTLCFVNQVTLSGHVIDHGKEKGKKVGQVTVHVKEFPVFKQSATLTVDVATKQINGRRAFESDASLFGFPLNGKLVQEIAIPIAPIPGALPEKEKSDSKEKNDSNLDTSVSAFKKYGRHWW